LLKVFCFSQAAGVDVAVGGGRVDVQAGGAFGVPERVVNPAAGGAGVQGGRDSGGGAHRDRAGLGAQHDRAAHGLGDLDVALIASARANAQVVETARQGVRILGPGTPAAVRLENIARFLDFVGENTARAAEQAREILCAKPEATPPGKGQGSPQAPSASSPA
jgi:hypothetical protein